MILLFEFDIKKSMKVAKTDRFLKIYPCLFFLVVQSPVKENKDDNIIASRAIVELKFAVNSAIERRNRAL